MKKLFLAVLILIFWAGITNAATLRCDAPAGEIKGYPARYTDGTTPYVWSFDGSITEISDMEIFFSLKFNVSYIFTLSAYNDSGDSPISLSTNSFTRTSYTPPPNFVPADVLQPPSQITNPLIDI